MTNLAASERASLSDLLDRVGPDAPTLCAGWNTRDLTAHLVVREGRPDAILGVVIRPLSGWTRRVQRKFARTDYTKLVNRLRGGPPVWSVFRLRAVGEILNNVEFFVHHEDVRRAQPDWQPRVLDSNTDNLLWQRSRRMARMVLRSTSGGIELVRSETGERHVARAPEPRQSTLTLTGTPQELLLYLFGRRDHARVECTQAAAS